MTEPHLVFGDLHRPWRFHPIWRYIVISVYHLWYVVFFVFFTFFGVVLVGLLATTWHSRGHRIFSTWHSWAQALSTWHSCGRRLPVRGNRVGIGFLYVAIVWAQAFNTWQSCGRLGASSQYLALVSAQVSTSLQLGALWFPVLYIRAA